MQSSRIQGIKVSEEDTQAMQQVSSGGRNTGKGSSEMDAK